VPVDQQVLDLLLEHHLELAAVVVESDLAHLVVLLDDDPLLVDPDLVGLAEVGAIARRSSPRSAPTACPASAQRRAETLTRQRHSRLGDPASSIAASEVTAIRKWVSCTDFEICGIGLFSPGGSSKQQQAAIEEQPLPVGVGPRHDLSDKGVGPAEVLQRPTELLGFVLLERREPPDSRLEVGIQHRLQGRILGQQRR
jgi:hypothetical protein